MKEKITECYGVAYKVKNFKALSKMLSDLFFRGLVEYALLVEHMGNNKDKHIHFYIVLDGFCPTERLKYLLGEDIDFCEISRPFEHIRNYLVSFDNSSIFEIGFRENKKD